MLLFVEVIELKGQRDSCGKPSLAQTNEDCLLCRYMGQIVLAGFLHCRLDLMVGSSEYYRLATQLHFFPQPMVSFHLWPQLLVFGRY